MVLRHVKQGFSTFRCFIMKLSNMPKKKLEEKMKKKPGSTHLLKSQIQKPGLWLPDLSLYLTTYFLTAW